MESVREVIRQQPSLEVEYVELVDPDQLAPVVVAAADSIMAVAVRAGRARLIDNILLGSGVDSDEVLD